MFDVKTCHLAALDSATKYPSISTYHAMADRGKLTENLAVTFNERVYVTEKCDGTNVRIILLPDHTYIIGSRDELLYAQGDLIPNRTLGIVANVKEIAAILNLVTPSPHNLISVVYGELYGHNINDGKQYTNTEKVGFCIFDIATMNIDIMEETVPKIAAWRDAGGQLFGSHDSIQQYCWFTSRLMVPQIAEIDTLPTTLEDTYKWLQSLGLETKANLDPDVKGKSEGVVVRTADRKLIAKIRFEDYERTFRSQSRGENK